MDAPSSAAWEGSGRASRPATARGGAEGSGGEWLASGALLFLLLVTVAWWTVALWPAPDALPGWLQTARVVCFGAHRDALPSAGGWILLVGEPLGMVGALYLIGGEPLLRGVRGLARSGAGRGALALAGATLLAGAGLAGWRVWGGPLPDGPAPEVDGAGVRALDRRPAPPLRLVDQAGAALTLERFRGRPVLVTFAYANCATVCPLLVNDALRARRRAGEAAPVLVVVTLDPWRDVPSRLPHIAAAWGLGSDAFVGSGPVEEVGAVLAAWGVAGVRDRRTGEIGHAPATYVVDRQGRLAFATSGRHDELVEALGRLR